MFKLFKSNAWSPKSAESDDTYHDDDNYILSRDQANELCKQIRLKFDDVMKENDDGKVILSGKQLNEILCLRPNKTKLKEMKESANMVANETMQTDQPNITASTITADLPTGSLNAAADTVTNTPKTTRQTSLDNFVLQGVNDTSWQVAGGWGKKRKVEISPASAQERVNAQHNESRKNLVKTSNRFASLEAAADDKETNEHSNKFQQMGTSATKRTRPPPIFIPNVEQIAGLLKTVESFVTKDNYNTTVMSNSTVSVNVLEVEDFRLLVREMRKLKIKFYTYQIKSERAHKVVIRQIHASVQPEEIKTALEELGFNCQNVTNIRHWRTKEPLPLFFVDLEPDDKMKEIYNLRSLLHMQIKVESPRPQKTIPQCHRCQQYGHTKAYCTLPEVCVKCGEGHTWDKCSKSKEEKPKCGLCGGDHTANYKGCPEYKKLSMTKSPKPPPNQREPDGHTGGAKKVVRRSESEVTYAEAAKTGTTTNVATSTNRIEELLVKLINQNETMMQLLQTVILKLVK